MASLNLCQTCGEPLDAEERCPTCDLLRAPTAGTGLPSGDEVSSGAPPDRDTQESISCVEPSCDAELDPADTSCFFCGTERAQSVTLAFPRGQLQVTSFPMVIGRSQSSPTAALCEAHDNVSRLHAELILHQGQLHIRDGAPGGEASTNGTFVNGQRIGPEHVPLRTGDELRLASDVSIEVLHE